MNGTLDSSLFTETLRDVSRSFYLTLRVLPAPVRKPIGLAYLLARAADTIADTEAISPEQRIDRLLELRGLLLDPVPSRIHAFVGDIQISSQNRGVTEGEKKLLQALPECFDVFRLLSESDRGLVVEVVTELTQGMELDLKRFSNPSTIVALEHLDQLEEYTYYVAGCVGPFWTKICVNHFSEFGHWDLEKMCALGIRFGKALQWTNVLRDMPRDLSNGRCYLPMSDLKREGLNPQDLKNPSSYGQLRSLYSQYLDHALEHYRAAWEYTMHIPKSMLRLRLACIWPIWIGLETIAMLRKAENPLDPSQRIRIQRGDVYRIMLHSLLKVRWDGVLTRHYEKLMKNASGRLNV
jgi:farnesyl-diphosphate farnesyltransferase